MSEPRTEAGKVLLTQSLRAESPALREWIELIEAEAIAADRAALAVRFTDIAQTHWWPKDTLAAILALLEEPR